MPTRAVTAPTRKPRSPTTSTGGSRRSCATAPRSAATIPAPAAAARSTSTATASWPDRRGATRGRHGRLLHRRRALPAGDFPYADGAVVRAGPDGLAAGTFATKVAPTGRRPVACGSALAREGLRDQGRSHRVWTARDLWERARARRRSRPRSLPQGADGPRLVGARSRAKAFATKDARTGCGRLATCGSALAREGVRDQEVAPTGRGRLAICGSALARESICDQSRSHRRSVEAPDPRARSQPTPVDGRAHGAVICLPDR